VNKKVRFLIQRLAARLLCSVVLLFFGPTVCLLAQSGATAAGAQGFCFHGSGVNLPIGKFLLIRNGDQIGALRITKIVHDEASKPRGTEWLGTVDYESYYLPSRSTSFANPGAKVYSGQLTFGRFKGFGFHYSWQSGHQYARVGPWKFLFFNQDGMFTTAVSFWHGIDDDSGLRFAATSNTHIASVNPDDSELHWYGYDNNRDIPCPEPLPPER
jgi:hypothetical protein